MLHKPPRAANQSAWPGPGGRTAPFAHDPVSEARLQAALTAGRTAAWHTNLQTRERWWSPEMFALHGLADTGEVPADYLSLVHPQDQERVRAAFAESKETGTHHLQYRVRWPDGSTHWVEGTGRTGRDEAGEPLAIQGVCSAIDARKRE